jgi:tight adherence protein C
MLAYTATPSGLGSAYSGVPERVSGVSAYQFGAQLTRQLDRWGIRYPYRSQDLVLTGRTFEDVMARKVLGGVAGSLLTVIAAIALRAAGFSVPLASPGILALAVGVALFFAPDLEVRREAAARRAEFRRALGAFLDLVALEMAGAAAPAEALPSAARRIGSGWSMALIRDCLYRATKSGQDHWQALTDLGLRIGVQELAELGSLIHLVRRDGARVRETLTARAATMRRTPQIVIGAGFMAFLIFPAIMKVIQL